MSRTILLIQSGSEPETRTYSDYENVNSCMKGICKIYEEHLKKQNTDTPTATYNIGDVLYFIDQLKNLSCFIHDKSTNTYVLYENIWIKEKLYTMMCEPKKHTKKSMMQK